MKIRKIKPPVRGTPPGTLYTYIGEFLYFKEATSASNTAKVYRHKLRRFEKFLNDERVTEVGPRAVFSYLLELKRQGKEVGSYLTPLNVFFDWCVTMGYIDTNPAKTFPPPRDGAKRHNSTEIFTDEEYSRLKTCAMGSEMYYAIVCGWHTAMRMSDVSMLEWESVRFDAQPHPVLSFVPYKTRRTSGVAVVIPIAPELMNILGARAGDRRVGERYVSEELATLYQRDPANISRMFTKVAARARIEGKKTFHTLRHTALTRWVNDSGGEHITVQKMSGHSSPATLSRYVAPSIEKMGRIMGL